MDKHFDFLFHGKNITVDFDDKGLAWFRGSEIARVLGYNQVNDMTRRLPACDVQVIDGRQLDGYQNGNQQIVLVSENGVYRIITRGTIRTPETREFQHWLFYTILRSMRRYGAYIDSETRDILNTNPNLILYSCFD